MSEEEKVNTDTEVGKEVDQTGYTDDALDNWENANFKPQDGFINDQNWRKENAEKANEEEEETQSEETDTTEKKDGEKPDDTVEQLFDFTTTDDSGKKVLDTGKAMDFFKPKEVKIPPPVETAQAPVTETEKKPTYEENMTSNLNAGLEYLKQYRDAGYDEATAMMYARQAIDRDLTAHFSDRRYNSLEEKFTAKEKALEEKSKMAEARPKSQANLTNAMLKNGWGDSKKLTAALLDNNLAGGFLAVMYRRENPGKTFTSAEEYSNALGEFLVKATADQETLTILEEVARARLFMRNIKHFLEKAKETKANVATSKKEAKIEGNQAVAKQKNKTLSKQGRQMMEYLHEIERE